MTDYLDKWESDIYAQGKALNRYTWGEVYYYTNRYFLPRVNLTEKINILELGSGTGNNLIFFAGLGINAYGIEASATACSIAREKLAEFKNIESTIICDNFCKQPLPFENNFFDLILDRGSITHNVLPDIEKVLSESLRMLKPGGVLLSIHFFSDNDSRFDRGQKLEKNTFKNIGGYTFKDVPLVHFSNLEEIRKLYKQFNLEFVEERTTKRYHPYENEEGATFDIIARKR